MRALRLKHVVDTFVFWDIKTYPVLSACDASRVAPCIRRVLKNKGYSASSATIVAFGQLTDVPYDVLRALSSTGIVLHHVNFRGSVGVLSTMYDWIRSDGSSKLMLISSNPSFFTHIQANSRCPRLRTFQLFPCDSPNAESLWKDLLLKEDKCSGTGEPSLWLCSACENLTGHGFENFVTHLNSREHAHEAMYEGEKAEDVTVFWDIQSCPVPPDYDPRRVGPCIKRFLKNKGYTGRITIMVIGLLADIPDGVLRALSSTPDLRLHIVARGSQDFVQTLYVWRFTVSSPANMMLICPCPRSFSNAIDSLQKFGYNTIQLFPSVCRNVESLWEKFLLEDSGTLEEDKCSETGEPVSWVCSECNDLCGRGFENFTMHLNSNEHAEMLTGYPEAVPTGDQAHPKRETIYVLPDPSYEKDKEAVTTGDQAHPKRATMPLRDLRYYEINKEVVPTGDQVHPKRASGIKK